MSYDKEDGASDQERSRGGKEQARRHQKKLQGKQFYYAPPGGPKVRGVAPVGALRGVHLYFLALLVTTGYYRLL